jgi:hypothetical protein
MSTDYVQRQRARVQHSLLARGWDLYVAPLPIESVLIAFIDPKWAVFVSGIPDPVGEAKQLFTKMQEAIRKDVERGFGVLQLRFAITKYPSRKWTSEKICTILKACVIMHNMIVEDERDTYSLFSDLEFEGPLRDAAASADVMVVEPLPKDLIDGSIGATMMRIAATRNSQMSQQLRDDLVNDLWKRKGRGQI